MEKLPAESLILTRIDYTGLQTLIAWAREEGWNPGPYDAEVFWNTDPDGYYGYYHNQDLIAGGSIVSYSGDFGFMGFFIVKPGMRGKGVGRKLWYERRDLLLKRLKTGSPIGMDGVVAMQPFYRNGGFTLAFRDERHMKTGVHFQVHPDISSITDKDMQSVLLYDKQCFGFIRSQFLIPWMKMQGTRTFKFITDGCLRGFSIMRKVFDGYKICPLFADDEFVAESLYQACLNAVPGEKVFLDIPVTNQAAVRLTKKYDTAFVFECARMYYGTPPVVESEKIFGITTFELG